jgi:hypothetical protein
MHRAIGPFFQNCQICTCTSFVIATVASVQCASRSVVGLGKGKQCRTTTERRALPLPLGEITAYGSAREGCGKEGTKRCGACKQVS